TVCEVVPRKNSQELLFAVRWRQECYELGTFGNPSHFDESLDCRVQSCGDWTRYLRKIVGAEQRDGSVGIKRRLRFVVLPVVAVGNFGVSANSVCRVGDGVKGRHRLLEEDARPLADAAALVLAGDSCEQAYPQRDVLDYVNALHRAPELLEA